jgi:ribosomal-protein-alanine N-acetyltransferase
MRVRVGAVDDLAALADVHARAFAQAWTETSLKSLISGPGVAAHIVEDDEICGFIVTRVAADEAEIITIAVRPDRHRQGLASALLKTALAQAEAAGATRAFLEVAARNLPARRLYEGQGFREVGRRKTYYADGDDALVLGTGLPLVVGNSGKTL